MLENKHNFLFKVEKWQLQKGILKRFIFAGKPLFLHLLSITKYGCFS